MGPVIWNVGIGARCVRKSSFVRGSPPKTRVDEGANPFRPVLGIGYDDGASPRRPTLGIGQDSVM